MLEVGSDCVRAKQVLVLDIVSFNDEFSVAAKNAFCHSSSGAGVSVKPHYKLDIVSLPRPRCFKVLGSLRLEISVSTRCPLGRIRALCSAGSAWRPSTVDKSGRDEEVCHW